MGWPVREASGAGMGDDARGEPVDAAGRSVGEIYEAIADWFDGARDRSLVEKGLLDALLAVLPPAPSVLDVGCGSGEPVARHLVGRGARVTGIDLSPSLLEKARARLPGERWHLADARVFTPEADVDAVVLWDCLFHLTRADQRRLLPRLAGHVRPGGALLFTCGWEEAEYWNAMGGHPTARMFNASLSSAEYRAILTGAGLSVLRHAVADPRVAGRTYWLARKAPGGG